MLPAGVEVRPQGAGTDENRRMLAAFRWNLRLLSYIALVVGAFLIYNTISVSVVRRRAEIGIVRALGASRVAILAAFLGEAAMLRLRRRAARAAARPADGRRRGEIDGRYGGIAVRQQPAGPDRVDIRIRVARVC